MRERPILFSGPMVRAILAGTKTQTRRVIKSQPGSTTSGYMELNPGVFKPIRSLPEFDGPIGGEGHKEALKIFRADENNQSLYCPFGVPGDRLWVRETWRPMRAWVGEHLMPGNHSVQWKADKDIWPSNYTWKSSIIMPRSASRLTLEITDIRVERVQDVDEKDAMSEGSIASDYGKSYRHAFSMLWDSLNAKRGYGWDVNPWVWVIQFKRLIDAGKEET